MPGAIVDLPVTTQSAEQKMREEEETRAFSAIAARAQLSLPQSTARSLSSINSHCNFTQSSAPLPIAQDSHHRRLGRATIHAVAAANLPP
ncbi:hypothetical protein M0R45_026429 [Rubus argutus]|uniref:Uncharacterized protein n=1 Tax=Rubus argutus TaxID=59490 RepID=A0AAW1X106_RUBAR